MANHTEETTKFKVEFHWDTTRRFDYVSGLVDAKGRSVDFLARITDVDVTIDPDAWSYCSIKDLDADFTGRAYCVYVQAGRDGVEYGATQGRKFFETLDAAARYVEDTVEKRVKVAARKFDRHNFGYWVTGEPCETVTEETKDADVRFKMVTDDTGRVGLDRVNGFTYEHIDDQTPFVSFVLTTAFNADRANAVKKILDGRSYYNPEILLVPTPGGIEVTVQCRTEDPVEKVKDMFLMLLADELLQRV